MFFCNITSISIPQSKAFFSISAFSIFDLLILFNMMCLLMHLFLMMSFDHMLSVVSVGFMAAMVLHVTFHGSFVGLSVSGHMMTDDGGGMVLSMCGMNLLVLVVGGCVTSVSSSLGMVTTMVLGCLMFELAKEVDSVNN